MKTTQDMTDYLRGMARHNPAAVKDAATYTGWAELAQALLSRHREDFLQRLTQAELQAIAQGQINITQAAQTALTQP